MNLEFDVVWYFNEDELRRIAAHHEVEIISIQKEGPAGGNPLIQARANSAVSAKKFLSHLLIEKEWSVLSVSPNGRKFMNSYIQGILLRERKT